MSTIFNVLLVTVFIIAVDLMTYAAHRFRSRFDNQGARDSLAHFSKKLMHVLFG